MESITKTTGTEHSKQIPECKVKKMPAHYNAFIYSIPYESIEERNLLPSPIIKFNDYYYQTIKEAGFEVCKDIYYIKTIMKGRTDK